MYRHLKLVAKCTIIIMALSLMLAACSSNNHKQLITYSEGDLVYPQLLETEWGMSKDEVLKALKLTDNDVTESGTDETGSAYTLETKYNDSDISIILLFSSKSIDEQFGKPMGLVGARIFVKDEEAKTVLYKESMDRASEFATLYDYQEKTGTDVTECILKQKDNSPEIKAAIEKDSRGIMKSFSLVSASMIDLDPPLEGKIAVLELSGKDAAYYNND